MQHSNKDSKAPRIQIKRLNINNIRDSQVGKVIRTLQTLMWIAMEIQEM